MSESKATKAQNLARIRDNQRRSRARRKEYLQELEAKIRSCEQMGVEASAEMQSAARRVLEENRRLRTMLRARGVPEAEISAALGANDRSLEQASAARALTSLLDRKWPCNGPSDESQCDSPTETASPFQPPSVVDLTPISIPLQPAGTRSRNDPNSPSSIISSTGSPPSYTSAPFFPTEMSPIPNIKAETVSQYNMYQFQQSPNDSWALNNPATYTADAVSYYNTTTCMNAANIIRTMRSDIGPELEYDLGCRTTDQNCRVTNPTVFTVMERYSNPTIRM
ncbi:hypothetical protein K491DRAFT_216333 [Lophiostoma macrostomum CBS 122681]|uniref:BZIP domain-containing protein n=1 Tax=Lophiostoma macrostomum CBS 122681 TaxID=1314788 RepID=A0A6A6TGJ8_9PLEO|nr:hypothetical protein K491DRAFT_216333 [Lophiostoma macrostomum CBS 122681]